MAAREFLQRLLVAQRLTTSFERYTLENYHFEPKDHPIKKKNHLPNLHVYMGSSPSIFQGVAEIEQIRGENLPLPIIFKAAFGGGGRGMRVLVMVSFTTSK